MDFLKIKDSLFSGSSTNVEKVEVNQRHLIDKILARYSAEFTVYRELIQNANDAGATEIQIEFNTNTIGSSKLSDKNKKSIKSIIIRNNGRAFTEDDWRRLKKIAEGNPDEQKIGFFGVGFYSLFSICEEPLVISGSKCLGFYWTGDQLYTKSAAYNENTENWTSICLELREPLELPEFDEFGQFLCKSLLFTYSISIASFSVDGMEMLKCSKTLSSPSSFKFPSYKTSSGLFNLKSLEGIFVQMTLEKKYQTPEPAEIDTSTATSVFSSLWRMAQNSFTEKGKAESALDSKLRQAGTFHVFLKHFRASSSVQTTTKFANEMERTTKKKPFRNVNVDLIYANWEQLNATSVDSIEGSKVSTKHPILSKLLPFPTNGKVFIGFETQQTSGFGVHFTAPFIPTVERESIDFVDNCLKNWNIELVQLTGRLSRLIYQNEVSNINFQTDPDYLKKAKHLMEAFNFKNSTPSQIISFTLFDEFLKYPDQLNLPSSNGFVPAQILRHVPEEMLKFVRNTPRIPDEIAAVCQEVLSKMALKQQRNNSNVIQTISIRDVIDFELKQTGVQMTEKESIACLNWWIKIVSDPYSSFRPQISQGLTKEFTDLFLVPSAQGVNTFLPLSKMSFYAGDELSGLYYSEKAKIKFFPIDCISPVFSSKFSLLNFSLIFSLQELNLADWLEGIVRWTFAKDSIESDSELAEQLLMLLSKHYNNSPSSVNLSIFQGRICSSLSSLKCIPIGGGTLKKPNECYFEDVPQLQVEMNILSFSTESRRGRVNETMLKASGVHSHLPIDKIFSNIGNLKWDHVSLIKYLVKVKDELSKSDMTKLKLTPLFPDAMGVGIYKLSELYADSINSDIIRILCIRILKWPTGIPKEGSGIGEFLADLGFNYTVPWRILLKGVESAPPSDRSIIFKYFFDNFSYYEDYNGSNVDFPFIPIESENGGDLSVFLPSQVFLDGTLNHLGFYLIHPEFKKYAQLLGIKERPSIDLISKQVIRIKLKLKAAEEVFSYCSRISNEFKKEDWKLFRQSEFIPCLQHESGAIEYKMFDQVFLQSNESSKTFSDLFDQIDFGVQANSFLRSVGVVEEPRAENLIALLLKDPIKVLSQLKAPKYIEMMQRIGQQWNLISSKHSVLAKSFVGCKAFIGYVRAKATGLKSEIEKETEKETEEKHQYSLYTINEVFLIDDVISHQLFNLPTTPINLEQFYMKLGSRWISSVIRSEWKWTGKVQSEGPLISSVRKILSERLNLIISSLDDDESKIIKGGRKRLESVKLFQVDSIVIFRTCTVNKETNSQPSCAFTDGAIAHPSIYLSKNSDNHFDHFDLAALIVNLLCDKKGRLQDSLLIASLLTTSLASLKAKGFQVENIEKKAVEEIILPSIKNEEKKEEHTKEHTSTNTDVIKDNASINGDMDIVSRTEKMEISSSKSEEQVPNTQKRGWRDSLLGFLKEASNSFSSSESLNKPPTQGKAGDVRNEESLMKTLDGGIKSLKSHESGDFDAVIPSAANEPASQNQQLQKEMISYCQTVSSLKLIGKMGTIDIYAGDSVDQLTLSNFFTDHKDSLITFYGLIINELGNGVFNINQESGTVHFYYDPESPTIAFNRNHSLFFNFAYFLANKHHLILNEKKGQKSAQRCKTFWFMTFCHELAHNFVLAHDVQHEFYMASFAETYLPDFIEKL